MTCVEYFIPIVGSTFVAGGSSTGKTCSTTQLLLNEKLTFRLPFENVILLNGGESEQIFYDKLKSHYTDAKMSILQKFEPEKLVDPNFYGNQRPCCVICDDLLDLLGRNDILLELVTKRVSRINFHLFFISQLISSRYLRNLKPTLRNSTCVLVPLSVRNRAVFIEAATEIFGSNKLYGKAFDTSRREDKLSFLLINMNPPCLEVLRIMGYCLRGLPSVSYPIFGGDMVN